MLAALMPRAAALRVTQAMPQATDDHEPEPWLFSARTEYRRAPGTTPATPLVLSLAPMEPATWAPWPLPSLKLLPVGQLTPPTTLRSECGPDPVSSTAIAGPLKVPLPFPESWELR